MTAFSLLNYEPDHGRHIVTTENQYSWIPAFVEVDTWLNGWKTGGPAYTLIADDQIVACGGATILWPGRAELWMILSDLFYRYRKTSVKYARGMIELMIQANAFERVEANVVAGDWRARRFVEWLGFEQEGIMRKFIMGADYVRYGMVR